MVRLENHAQPTAYELDISSLLLFFSALLSLNLDEVRIMVEELFCQFPETAVAVAWRRRGSRRRTPRGGK